VQRIPGRLAGERALVTGATSGLGLAIVQRFVAEGAAVVGMGRDAVRGAAMAERTGAVFVPGDLAEPGTAERVVERTVAALGGLTVLVNNAVPAEAIGRDSDVVTAPVEVWQRMFDVVVLAAARLCAAAIPHMRAAGHGSIVNVSSRVAARGTPGLAAYGSCKAALEALARSVTADHAAHGVRANSVRPGYMLHEDRDADLQAAARRRVEDMHLTRLTTAADVAAAVVFLAGPESATVSGVALPVDGGSSAVRGRTLG
jgi:NAD(P)-dependent dehydrogenase (short-subunit alcohol dehydrogenase family)